MNGIETESLYHTAIGIQKACLLHSNSMNIFQYIKLKSEYSKTNKQNNSTKQLKPIQAKKLNTVTRLNTFKRHKNKFQYIWNLNTHHTLYTSKQRKLSTLQHGNSYTTFPTFKELMTFFWEMLIQKASIPEYRSDFPAAVMICLVRNVRRNQKK